MSSKKQPRKTAKSNPVPRSPQPASHNPLISGQRQTHPADIHRRAETHPESLTRDDVLQLQRAFGNRATSRLLAHVAEGRTVRQEKNKTGLPDELKDGVEALSGLSMDDVKVHHNSPKPAEVQALAYTQGTDIHVGPGQERHLPHEAWHVVQQKQGRVKPTLQAKGLPINDDEGLEREADVMGTRAQNSLASVTTSESSVPAIERHRITAEGGETVIQTKPVLQRKNLQQANLDSGLTDDKLKLFLNENNPRKVNQYSQKAAGEAASKLEALNKAGEMNAAIGNRIKNWTWTPREKRLDNGRHNSKTLDPFYYRAEVPYKANNKTETLNLAFQHAARFTGYLTFINDSSNQATTNWVEMYEKNPIGPQLKPQQKYSNIHDLEDASKLIDLTSGGEEKHFDAYTKIAGEGARWQCVRKHAAKLKNKSIFYVKQKADQNDKSGWGVTFENLWLTWAASFDKAYDIPDKTVADKLLNDQVKTKNNNKRVLIPDITKMTDEDYQVVP